MMGLTVLFIQLVSLFIHFQSIHSFTDNKHNGLHEADHQSSMVNHQRLQRATHTEKAGELRQAQEIIKTSWNLLKTDRVWDDKVDCFTNEQLQGNFYVQGRRQDNGLFFITKNWVFKLNNHTLKDDVPTIADGFPKSRIRFRMPIKDDLFDYPQKQWWEAAFYYESTAILIFCQHHIGYILEKIGNELLAKANVRLFEYWKKPFCPDQPLWCKNARDDKFQKIISGKYTKEIDKIFSALVYEDSYQKIVRLVATISHKDQHVEYKVFYYNLGSDNVVMNSVLEKDMQGIPHGDEEFYEDNGPKSKLHGFRIYDNTIISIEATREGKGEGTFNTLRVTKSPNKRVIPASLLFGCPTDFCYYNIADDIITTQQGLSGDPVYQIFQGKWLVDWEGPGHIPGFKKNGQHARAQLISDVFKNKDSVGLPGHFDAAFTIKVLSETYLFIFKDKDYFLYRSKTVSKVLKWDRLEGPYGWYNNIVSEVVDKDFGEKNYTGFDTVIIYENSKNFEHIVYVKDQYYYDHTVDWKNKKVFPDTKLMLLEEYGELIEKFSGVHKGPDASFIDGKGVNQIVYFLTNDYYNSFKISGDAWVEFKSGFIQDIYNCKDKKVMNEYVTYDIKRSTEYSWKEFMQRSNPGKKPPAVKTNKKNQEIIRFLDELKEDLKNVPRVRFGKTLEQHLKPKVVLTGPDQEVKKSAPKTTKKDEIFSPMFFILVAVFLFVLLVSGIVVGYCWLGGEASRIVFWKKRRLSKGSTPSTASSQYSRGPSKAGSSYAPSATSRTSATSRASATSQYSRASTTSSVRSRR